MRPEEVKKQEVKHNQHHSVVLLTFIDLSMFCFFVFTFNVTFDLQSLMHKKTGCRASGETHYLTLTLKSLDGQSANQQSVTHCRQENYLKPHLLLRLQRR